MGRLLDLVLYMVAELPTKKFNFKFLNTFAKFKVRFFSYSSDGMACLPPQILTNALLTLQIMPKLTHLPKPPPVLFFIEKALNTILKKILKTMTSKILYYIKFIIFGKYILVSRYSAD